MPNSIEEMLKSGIVVDKIAKLHGKTIVEVLEIQHNMVYGKNISKNVVPANLSKEQLSRKIAEEIGSWEQFMPATRETLVKLLVLVKGNVEFTLPVQKGTKGAIVKVISERMGVDLSGLSALLKSTLEQLSTINPKAEVCATQSVSPQI